MSLREGLEWLEVPKTSEKLEQLLGEDVGGLEQGVGQASHRFVVHAADVSELQLLHYLWLYRLDFWILED